ncbi:MAG: pilin [Candidatus Paceibacterota bacterium]|jgi:hypothetical protein
MSILLAQGVESLRGGLRQAADAAPGLPKSATVPTLVGTVIGSLLSVAGIAFFALMIYGGFLWMTARGNEQQTGKAKNTITAAVIGIVIVLASYAVTNFVLQSTQGAPSAGSVPTAGQSCPPNTNGICAGKKVGDVCTDPGGITATCVMIGAPVNTCSCGG